MKTFISLTWTEDISDSEVKVLIHTVAERVIHVGERVGLWFQSQALPTVRPFGDWVILMAPRGSAYSSLEWYLNRCRTPDGNRLDGPAYLRLVEMEPWQSSTPHFDVALVTQNLADAEGQSVLNVALPGLAAIASVHHVRRLGSHEARVLGLRYLVAHALGRAVGIPLPTRPTGTITHGKDVYCTNLCAMRPCTHLHELLEYGMESMGWPNLYCQTCERDLEAVFIGSYCSLN